MKLLQLNIWGGRLEPQILKLITKEQPDIVCLQEVFDLKGGKGLLFASLDQIQEAMGAEYSFMSPVFSANYMKRRLDYGNAIISKFPITEMETIFTGGQYVDDFDYTDSDSNVRNLQKVAIALPDYDLTVLNHHGHHIREHKNGDDETMRQCKIIADQAMSPGEHTILTGDFNLAPHSESIEQINSVLTNLSLKHALSTTRTELTHKTEVCDYIFVSDDINVTTFKALDEIVSDHKALVVEFN